MKPDLTTLYSELDLAPDCSLAEFQLACRRRISELQPRRLGRAATPESHAQLRNLIELYTTATRFHRRYGRLPGAAPDRRQDDAAFRGRMPLTRVSQASSVSAGESPSLLFLGMAALLILLLIAAVLVSI